MKNSNFIKIFVITFICFFSLNFKVKGADCTYSLTIDSQYRDAINQMLGAVGVRHNGLNELEESLKKRKQDSCPSIWAMCPIYEKITVKHITFNLYSDGNYTAKFDFNANVTKYNSLTNEDEESMIDDSYETKGKLAFTNNVQSCPMAVFGNFADVDSVEMSWDYNNTLNIDDYISNNSGQTIVGYLGSHGKGGMQIMLPLSNTYGNSNYRINEYFDGFICKILASGDRTIYDIFDEYRRSGFDYEQIYKSGGNIQSINELIKNSILKLPYFSYSTKKYATNAIEEDLAILEQFNKSVVPCLEYKVSARNWGTTGINSSDDWFEKYEPTSSEHLYVDMMISILKQILENDLYDIVSKVNKESTVKSVIESQCPQDQNIKNICLDGVCENFSKIRCDYIKMSIAGDSIADDINRELTNNEDLIATYISQVCDQGDVDCQNNYCNQFKNQCSNIVNNNTETQKKYDEIISNITKDVIGQIGYEIDDIHGICDLLYNEDKGIGVYLYGLMDAIKIIGPILVIILTGLDAMKMITSGKEDEQKKFFNRLKIRLICLALLFLIPSIIEFLVKIFIEDEICNIRHK